MENGSRPRINIAQPCYGPITPQAHLSYGTVVARAGQQGILAFLGSTVGAYLDTARNALCEQTLEKKCTHLLFIDHDMVVPYIALDRLLAHGMPVVGALYFSKDHGHSPVALDLRRHVIKDLCDLPQRHTDADYPKDSSCACGHEGNHVHEVGVIGMGFTLIEADVLRRIADMDRGPWFKLRKGGGEDIHFADQCRRLGIPIMLDGFLQCGHMRDEAVCVQHYRAVRGMAQ